MITINTEEKKIKTKNHFQVIDITSKIRNFVNKKKVTEGQVSVTTKHTTTAIRVNENEPLLMKDIKKYIISLVPFEGHQHDIIEKRKNCPKDEPKNAHAHLKALLMGASETLPIKNGKLDLGKWQRVFFIELDGPRERAFAIELIAK